MKFQRYEVIKELGRGMMGIVYLAHDPKIGRNLALKVLRKERMENQSFVNRFLKEARAIGKLSHPNIVSIYDVVQENDTIFLAMEYLRGKSLDLVIKEMKLSIEQIIKIGTQIADALDCAHQQGIVHRDIKPSNIILDTDGNVKITDFGIAHMDDPAATQHTQDDKVFGTPSYMSPEQILGKTVTGASDLYSLGVVLYEMGTNVRPFAGSNLHATLMSITHDKPLQPSEVNPALPLPFSDLIMKSIEKDPGRRFRDGKEIKKAFDYCLRYNMPSESTVKDYDPDNQYTMQLSPESNGTPIKKIAVYSSIMLVCLLGIFYYLLIAKTKKTDAIYEKQQTVSMVQPEKKRSKQAQLSKLNVNSEPSGAVVYINNENKGITPISIDLAPGKYEAGVRLNGYFEWDAQIEVQKNQELPLFVRLIPLE